VQFQRLSSAGSERGQDLARPAGAKTGDGDGAKQGGQIVRFLQRGNRRRSLFQLVREFPSRLPQASLPSPGRGSQTFAQRHVGANQRFQLIGELDHAGDVGG
jgi:hypothetical protein